MVPLLLRNWDEPRHIFDERADAKARAGLPAIASETVCPDDVEAPKPAWLALMGFVYPKLGGNNSTYDLAEEPSRTAIIENK